MDETSPPSEDERTDETVEETRQEETADDEVDEASADSFPASDPPSFTGSTTD